MCVKWLFLCSSGGERGREREKAKAIICSVCMYIDVSQHEKSSCCCCCFCISEWSFMLLLDDICFLLNLMMMMIDSATLESDSEKHLCISIPTKEFDDINNNNHSYQREKPLFDCNHPMKSNILSSNDTTLLTTTTMTTRVEVKVKTTKTSSRKRKLDLINPNNNEEKINQQAAITKKKVRRIEAQKIEKRKFNLYFSSTHTHMRHPRGIMIS